MKVTTNTVWNSDQGAALLKWDGKTFQVVPAYCTPQQLRELGEAILDALSVPADRNNPETALPAN